MRLHPGLRDNESSLLDNETYPTLDLQVVEVLRQEGPMGASGDATEPPPLANQPAAQQIQQQRRRRRVPVHTGSTSGSHKEHRSCERSAFYVTFSGKSVLCSRPGWALQIRGQSRFSFSEGRHGGGSSEESLMMPTSLKLPHDLVTSLGGYRCKLNEEKGNAEEEGEVFLTKV